MGAEVCKKEDWLRCEAQDKQKEVLRGGGRSLRR